MLKWFVVGLVASLTTGGCVAPAEKLGEASQHVYEQEDQSFADIVIQTWDYVGETPGGDSVFSSNEYGSTMYATIGGDGRVSLSGNNPASPP